MDIKMIYKSICQHITGGKLLLNDGALGLDKDILKRFLTEESQTEVLEITEAEPHFDEMNLRVTVKGNCQWMGYMSGVEISFNQEEQAVWATFEMTARNTCSFDYFKPKVFQADETVRRYEFLMEEGFHTQLLASGNVKEALTLGDLVGILLDLDFSFLPPVQFQEMKLIYGREYWMGHWGTKAAVESKAKIPITDKIAVGDLGIGVDRQEGGGAFGLMLKGSAFLLDIRVPVVMKYNQKMFLFGIDAGKGGMKIPSIAAAAALVDLDLTEVLPEKFTLLGNLQLKDLSMIMDASFSGVHSFRMAIASKDRWEFPGLPALSLGDIEASFSADFAEEKAVCQGKICGRIQIGSLALLLSGQKSTGKPGFIFRTCLPTGGSVHFAQLAQDLSELLGLGKFRLPIPDLVLATASFSLDTGDGSLHLNAGITYEQNSYRDSGSLMDKLFTINACIDLDSKKEAGKGRSFSGTFWGSLMICGQKFRVEYQFGNGKEDTVSAVWSCEEKGQSPLSLVKMMEAFGVQELLEGVQVLNISCDSVSLVYSISKKKMSLKVHSSGYGKFACAVWEDNQKKLQYLVRIKCEEDVYLSNLPVVGSGLHLLGDVSVCGLELTAASADMQEEGVAVGFAVQGNLCIEDSIQPFKLELGGKKEEDPAEYQSSESNAAENGFTKWFTVEKAVGIFHFRRLGVTYQKGAIGFVLDAGLAANPLGLEAMGLGLGLAFGGEKTPVFFLSGLEVGYSSPTLTVSGAFLDAGGGRYDGEINIQTGKVDIFAVGSYQQGSLMAYAVIGVPLGGPPAFYVTGLAAGFGYNRNLLLPDIEEVKDFPLVQGAFGKLNRSSLLDVMNRYIQESKGQSFLAAGVSFTSFAMAKSFLLATVAFGKRLEIAVLGLSEIDIPANVETDPIAHAQLALRAVISPSEGIVSIQAELTSESYILSRKCVITGGFAFFLWFGGEHQGDFVISLGGYHRAYKKPAHYPEVPRLGFSWDITTGLRLAGEIYFALTPANIMAGGKLEASYCSGELRAWFLARVDFLMGWKPFYYDIDLYVGLGASYRMFVLFGYVTFKLELSAQLHIWGPEFAGMARISWFIISFTIRFGDSDAKKKYITWENFEQSFLPVSEKNAIIPTAIIITEGIRGSSTGKDEEKTTVEPRKLKIQVSCAIPATSIYLGPSLVYEEKKLLGVLPMGENQALKSALTIWVEDENEKIIAFEKSEIQKSAVPSAMWGKRENPKEEESLIKDTAVGVVLEPLHKPAFQWLPSEGYLSLDKLIEYEKIKKDLLYSKPLPISGPVYPQQETLKKMGNTLMEKSVTDCRRRAVGQMCKWGFVLENEISLIKLACQAEQVYYEELVLQSMR